MNDERMEFEKKCGVLAGCKWSVEKGKYVVNYDSESAYLDTINQNAFYTGWKAAREEEI